jgi:opacity protein-like surface antigen
MVKKFAIGAFATLCLCGSTIFAAEPGTYAGLSYGQASVAQDKINFDESDTGFKAFVGYTFNSYAAIELNYMDGPAPIVELPTSSVGVAPTAVTASAIVSFPFQRSFAAFAKLGFSFYDTETATLTGGQVSTADDSAINLAYGIGATYAFLERYEVRVEYESIAVEDGDFSMLSIGGVYRF